MIIKISYILEYVVNINKVVEIYLLSVICMCGWCYMWMLIKGILVGDIELCII